MKFIISSVHRYFRLFAMSVTILFISFCQVDSKADPQYIRVLDVEAVKSYEQTLLERLPYNVRSHAKTYLPAIIKISKFHGLDPLWVLSIVWTESHFKTHARSSVGARGLMQLMPKTKEYVYLKYRRQNQKLLVEKVGFQVEHFIKNSDIEDKKHVKHLANIEIGVIYLKRLLDRFGSRKLATVAYNMGPTWTSNKLRKKHPIGNRNVYLAKVDRAFEALNPQI